VHQAGRVCGRRVLVWTTSTKTGWYLVRYTQQEADVIAEIAFVYFVFIALNNKLCEYSTYD